VLSMRLGSPSGNGFNAACTVVTGLKAGRASARRMPRQREIRIWANDTVNGEGLARVSIGRPLGSLRGRNSLAWIIRQGHHVVGG